VSEVSRKVFASYVKDKDQNLHVFKYVLSLTLKVLLHEHILASTVPETQHQIAQESDPAFVNIYCESDAVGVSCEVVRKDNRSH